MENKITEHNHATFHFQLGEILNIDKPSCITSFQIVQSIRRWTGCKKVGHAGTLDPMATGVLLVCTEKATKNISSLMELEKIYEGTIELGMITDTDDAEGHVLSKHSVPNFSLSEIEDVLKKFQGEIEQIPPQFSAIKRKGVPLYKFARKGIYVPLEPRKIVIHDITILEWKSPILKVRVCCGKGTYIRSLARDIGLQLKTGGYLTALRRISIGSYHVNNAWKMDKLKSVIINNESLSIR